MSLYRFSAAERFGVWEAHDGMCFWCGEPLEFRHVTVDHVLPESLGNDPKKLTAILKSFALGADFKINDFPNWVPAHQSCNSKKNATVFSPSPVMVASLEYVSRRAPQAQSICEKVEKNRTKGKILALLEDAATEGLVTKPEIESLFLELHPPHVERPIVLRISSHWTVVKQDGDIAYVTNGVVGGYTTTAPNPDPSFICPFCNSAGPWNGVFCLTCHRMSDPAD
jgi:hypothetical protein